MCPKREGRLIEYAFDKGEVIPFDKPSGLSSFQLVKKVRRLTGCKKVGHAGTLDPLATGLLLICTGKATKRFDELTTYEKVYEGTVELGVRTSTDDAEGEIIKTGPVPNVDEETIQHVLKTFEGEIDQVPPMFSALKRNGKPLYKLARRGEILELEPRRVHVYEMRLVNWSSPVIHIQVRCGRGTYIRSLARDIGIALQTEGYLKTLKRTRIGPFRIEDALTMEQFEQKLKLDVNSSFN